MIFIAGYFIRALLLMFLSWSSSWFPLLFYEYGCSCIFLNWAWHCYSILLFSLGLNMTYWVSGHDSYFIFAKLCCESCRCQKRTMIKETCGSAFLPGNTNYLYKTQRHILNRYSNKIFHWFFSTLKYIFGQKGKKKSMWISQCKSTNVHE